MGLVQCWSLTVTKHHPTRGACAIVAADFNVQAEQVARCVNIAQCYDYASENNMDLVDVIRHAYTNKQTTGGNMDSDLGGMIADVENELKKDIANYPAFDWDLAGI